MRAWLIFVVMAAAGGALRPQEPMPKDWIDAATGHRIVRLTDDAGGSTLYFHDIVSGNNGSCSAAKGWDRFARKGQAMANAPKISAGSVLPTLRRVAAAARGNA